MAEIAKLSSGTPQKKADASGEGVLQKDRKALQGGVQTRLRSPFGGYGLRKGAKEKRISSHKGPNSPLVAPNSPLVPTPPRRGVGWGEGDSVCCRVGDEGAASPNLSSGSPLFPEETINCSLRAKGCPHPSRPGQGRVWRNLGGGRGREGRAQAKVLQPPLVMRGVRLVGCCLQGAWHPLPDGLFLDQKKRLRLTD